jgi:diguanylate cyclase (GGDEF)-like protein
MVTSGTSDREVSLFDGISPSPREAAAERRDLAADDRDLAAEVRDGLAGSGEQLSGNQRELAAGEREGAAEDRRQAAEDRRQAAEDRQAARHELAFQGLDALTGVMGRRVGLAALQREMERSERTGETLVVAFVDTVGLKTINDSRGHGEGDRVLREVASCITEDLRSYDLVTRVGGDEYVCTLAGQSVAQARERYEQISLRLAERSNGAQITVGLAEYESGDSLADLVNRADQAMIGARR